MIISRHALCRFSAQTHPLLSGGCAAVDSLLPGVTNGSCVSQEAENRRLEQAEGADAAVSRAAPGGDSEQSAEELRQNIAVPMAYNYV